MTRSSGVFGTSGVANSALDGERTNARDRRGSRRLALSALVLLAALLTLGAAARAGARPLDGATPGSRVAGGPAIGAPGRGAVPLRGSSLLRLFHPARATAGVLAARREPLKVATGPIAAPRTSASPARAAATPAAPASCAVPGAPGSPGASAGSNRATISWTAAADNGTAISAYIVREVSGPNRGASIATNATGTSAVLTGLAGGSAATFSIVAVSSCGTGPAATTSAITPSGATSTYLGSVQANTPSVFYRLDEPSGTVIADSSGHAADGGYSGQQGLNALAALASDPAPSSSYTTCCSGIGTGSASIAQYGSPRTIEAWVNTTSANAQQAIVGYGQTQTDEAFVLSISPQAINVDAWNDLLSFPTPQPLNTGAWHMIAASFDGSTVSVYLDGVLVGSSPFSGTVNTLMGGGFEIGGFPGYNMFNGDMADLAVFPSALTGAQINTHFAGSGYGRPTAPVVPHAATGGNDAVQVSWGASSAANTPITGYLVSVINGEHGSSVAVSGDATAARVTGLAAGTYTFQITPMDAYGNGPTVRTNSVTVTGAASTYASSVLSAGPSAFYRLADTTSTAMADSSGHGATGVYDPAATLGQPGPLGNDNAAAISDAANTPAGGSNASLPLYASARTLEAWVSTTAACCATQWIAGYGITSTAQGFSVGVQSNAVYVSGWSDDLVFASPVALNDGVWHVIAASTDASKVTVFVDGNAIGTQTFPQQLDTLPGLYPQSLLIGAATGNCCGGFNGQLADVAIFPSQLSGATVAAQFAASGLGRPPAPTGPSATAGVNQATVSWTAPTGANPDVTGYVITALKSGVAANAISVPAGTTSTTLTGLAGGGSYTFRIQAVNAYGPGTAATTSPAVTPTGTSSTYASTTIADAPLAFYRLADFFTLMADSSGHGATGFYGPSAALGQTGPLGNDTATAIADSATAIAGGAVPSLPLYNGARTLEAWINTTSSASPWVAGYGNTSTTQGFAIGVSANAVLVSGYNDDLSFTSPVPLLNGVWHFIAARTDGNTVTAFVDGNAIGTQTFPQQLDTLALGSAPQGLLIGAGIGNCCGYFNGQLADVALFGGQLTSAQVTAQFAASGLGAPPAPTNASATAGQNQATVSWTAPAGAKPAITGYLVTALKSGAAANAITAPAGAASATVTGLVGGGSYTFRVQAVNAYGPGAAATTSPAVTPTGATSTYASTVLSAGPSVFYRLADTGPAAMADSSGHGVNGFYNTSAATLNQTGPLGNDPAAALSDNGQSPLAQSHPSLPLYNNPRSVGLWVNTTSCCSTQWVLSYGPTINNDGFAVGFSPGAVSVSGYNDDVSFTSPAALNNGLWHFIAVTTDGTSVTVYLDGAAIGTKTFPHVLNTLPAVQGLLLGSGIGNCCGGYGGQLADVAAYPTQLTSAQVQAQFAASGLGVPGAPTSPRATAGANQATVSWTAPTGVNPPIKAFLVTALKSGVAANAVAVPSSATSTTITGLVGGGSYTFQIKALNNYGLGSAATTSAVSPTGATSTYASTVLSAGPSGFYRLADTTASLLADSSGHNANGAYSPSATLNQSGPLGNDPAPAISDSGGSAGQANPSLPLYNGPRTLEGWINTTSASQNLIAGYGASSTNQALMLAEQPNAVIVSGYNNDLSLPSPARLNDGVWHLVAVTSDGTSATAYVDGKSLGTRKFPQVLNTQPTQSGLLLGNGAQGCCGGLSGQLADVAVFPTALSAAQLTAQFTASGLGAPPAPTAPSAVAGSNQATVSWTAPSSANPVITGYLVTALKSGVTANAQSVPAGAVSTTITGLAGGSAYTFRIQAVNVYGPGAAATTSAVSPTGAASTYASTTLSYGPSAFYRLGDTAASAMADSSGHGATGVYTSSATLGQAGPLAGDASGSVLGNGAGFFGQAHPSLPLFNSPRTVETWMKTTTGGYQVLVSYGRASANQAFGVSEQPGSVYVLSESNDLTFTSPTALNDGNWHFIAVITNGSSATAYVDGTSLGTQSFATTIDTLPALEGLMIGSNPQGVCCNAFSGNEADVAIFPTALSAAQITAQKNASTMVAPLGRAVAPSTPATATGATGGAPAASSTTASPTLAPSPQDASMTPPGAGSANAPARSALAAGHTTTTHARHKTRRHTRHKRSRRATRHVPARAAHSSRSTTGGRS
jgi:hypothetical protein